MARLIHNALWSLTLVVTALLFLGTSTVMAADLDSQLVQWERLDHERAALIGQLKNLEQDHQESVDTIEKLKRRVDRGAASRSDLEEELRKNHRIVYDLEQLQRRLAALDDRQASLRSSLLDSFDERRQQLEQQLRQSSSSDERGEIVKELNDLQTQRQRFRAPLPEADQQRLEQILADARAVSGENPRAMLSAADELEDTREQLEARLRALDDRIRELEQARRLARHSRQFGQFDRFFDESDRSRTIADYQHTIEADEAVAHRGDDEALGSSDADDALAEFTDDAPESDPGSAPPEPEPEPEPSPTQTETIVIEAQTDPEQAETTYFDDRALERDLRRLQRERQGLEEQTRQIEEKADELRREAQQLY